MQKFNDKIEESDWSASNSIRQWYKTFLEDYQAGKLTAVTNAGTTTCTKNENEQPVVNADIIVPEEYFYPCLAAWLGTDKGKLQFGDIVFSDDNKVIGWR